MDANSSSLAISRILIAASLVVADRAFALDEPVYPFSASYVASGPLADVNGDGILDTVAWSMPSGEARYSRGNGDGTFDFVAASAFGPVLDAFLADLDGDGRADALGSSYSVAAPHPTSFHRAFGSTSGLSASTVLSAGSTAPRFVEAGDFDGDGDLDVLVTDWNAQLHRFANDGFGNLAESGPALPSVGSLAHPPLADVDDDGRLDIVTSDLVDDEFHVLRNAGGGVFQDVAVPLPAGTTGAVIAVGDFDGNGRSDVVTRSLSQYSVTLHSNTSSTAISFAPKSAYALPVSAESTLWLESLVAVDFDLDGKCDLAGFVSSALQVAKSGETASGLQARTQYESLAPTGYFADVDSDGRIDAVQSVSSYVTACVSDVDSAVATSSGSAGSGTALDAVVTLDVDGDGDLDVITDSPSDNGLLLKRNAGDGTLSANETLIAAPAGITVLRAIDRDGDGDLDLFAATTTAVHAFRNDGNATFTLLAQSASTTLASGPTPRLTFADFNADGIVDVAVGVPFQLAVSLGTATGFATATPFSIQKQHIRDLASGDVTGDGKADLVTLECWDPALDGSLVIYPGNGLGGFGTGIATAIGTFPLAVAVGDLDAGGGAEIAVSSLGDHSLRTFRYSTTTGFALGDAIALYSGEVPSPIGSGHISLTDVDRDGFLDLLPWRSSGAISVLYGTGSGAFDSVGDFALKGADSVAVGDLNGDDLADLISVGGTDNQFYVALAKPLVPTITEYGMGKAGTKGVPALSALTTGPQGEFAGFLLTHGVTGTSPMLLFGGAPIALPFDGGTLLVDPIAVISMPPFDAAGHSELPFTLPALAGLNGVQACFQAMFVDLGGTGSMRTAQSNGVLFTFH